ncbi:SDR family NAD(P)-dependent oxidoreductase [Fulvimarina sp. 2208YS6-2-32]|uniref:SDR family NAD(P)-dependent oxidoreductase n=1 Tax=Fulvimarina uroteuthidis TaxID=3098149 RepID=A0ABU5I1B9_9HYPH|nr:SDR family NAD(P)-dependent oxidoreductase [Fulvimarina sp. 2208YS6-2-32]MDY8108927.1 SDR family NAD(P)-dependent oxidoreductase [Fulvimarina sp. 2208YS6-2-32]
MKLFVFGHGYSASHYVGSVASASVLAVTVRSIEKAERLAESGVKALVFDGENYAPDVAETLGEATHILVSVPPGHRAPPQARVGGANAPEGDPVLKLFAETILTRCRDLQWIGYLSTVGVYGDHDGLWVDEDTPVKPSSERSKARVAAEDGWKAVAERRGVPLAILRLSGIYGPGQNAFVSLRKGTAKRLIKPGQVFNRIHVEDIAGSLSLLADGRIGGIFNVTDDEPAPPQDVVAHAADLAGVEPPPETRFEEADLSPMARSFYGENKRVSNARIKHAGYTFRYPTYREALEALKGDCAPA